MMPRLSLALLSLLLVVILPWWASGGFLLSLIFLFPWYYEAILSTLAFDILYGANSFWLTIAVLIIIPLVEELKKRLYVFS